MELPPKTELEETDLRQQAGTLYSSIVPLKSGVHHTPSLQCIRSNLPPPAPYGLCPCTVRMRSALAHRFPMSAAPRKIPHSSSPPPASFLGFN